jgi:hypothetical protein
MEKVFLEQRAVDPLAFLRLGRGGTCRARPVRMGGRPGVSGSPRISREFRSAVRLEISSITVPRRSSWSTSPNSRRRPSAITRPPWKGVVASAISEDGEELFPRKWNEEYIEAPLIDEQRQPSSTSEGVRTIVAVAKGQYQMLYALLAGCGPLRAGEALGRRLRRCSKPSWAFAHPGFCFTQAPAPKSLQ